MPVVTIMLNGTDENKGKLVTFNALWPLNNSMTFREFLNPGALSNTGIDGYDPQTFGTGHALNMPTPTLHIPTKVIKGKIQRIFYTNNPISIALENGTVWKLTKEQWDYLVTTGKEPREGAIASLELYYDGTLRGVSYS